MLHFISLIALLLLIMVLLCSDDRRSTRTPTTLHHISPQHVSSVWPLEPG